MIRKLFGCVLLSVVVLAVGCCGPLGCGPGCGAGVGCNDCDVGFEQQMIRSPLDGVRNLKRSLVCGSGCGETYIGEWISTPPDCADPCCNDQWVGGATKCRPFCWQPGALFRGVYGSRFCTGSESSVPCDCGECDTCAVADAGHYTEEVVSSASSGCSTCQTGTCASCRSASVSNRGTRIVHRPVVDPVTRSAARRLDPEVQRIRR
jgi:hypothetical protein